MRVLYLCDACGAKKKRRRLYRLDINYPGIDICVDCWQAIVDLLRARGWGSS